KNMVGETAGERGLRAPCRARARGTSSSLASGRVGSARPFALGNLLIGDHRAGVGGPVAPAPPLNLCRRAHCRLARDALGRWGRRSAGAEGVGAVASARVGLMGHPGRAPQPGSVLWGTLAGRPQSGSVLWGTLAGRPQPGSVLWGTLAGRLAASTRVGLMGQ